ncbi:MAG: hypothetical protein L0H64_03515 [Pseudonocardia sp.]|nr:hypothetical protein [Pseudonocardia sp.]
MARGGPTRRRTFAIREQTGEDRALLFERPEWWLDEHPVFGGDLAYNCMHAYLADAQLGH